MDKVIKHYVIQRISGHFDRYYFREALYLVALMETLYAERNIYEPDIRVI